MTITESGPTVESADFQAVLARIADAGGAANGRIFGARGHVITLYSEPERERTLRFPEPFIDIDELFALWPQTLGAEPLERTQAWT